MRRLVQEPAKTLADLGAAVHDIDRANLAIGRQESLSLHVALALLLVEPNKVRETLMGSLLEVPGLAS
jgi:hypothetical protein